MTQAPEKSRRNGRRFLWKIVRAVLLVYFTIALMMVWFENKLIYFPTKYPIGEWEPDYFEFEDAYFKSSDGTRIHGWLCDHSAAEHHIMYCHGNADYVANLGGLANEWRARFNAAVFVFDYRGYGRSEGKPQEEGVIEDAKAARKWFADRVGIAESEIVLVGRSLGGGVVSAIAAEPRAKGVILQSTFSALPDAAATHYPWLPVKLLMRNRFNSQKNIQLFSGPVLQSHGTADSVVPIQLGRKLHQAIPGRKQFFEIENGDHNDREPEAYYQAVQEFLDSL